MSKKFEEKDMREDADITKNHTQKGSTEMNEKTNNTARKYTVEVLYDRLSDTDYYWDTEETEAENEEQAIDHIVDYLFYEINANGFACRAEVSDEDKNTIRVFAYGDPDYEDGELREKVEVLHAVQDEQQIGEF